MKTTALIMAGGKGERFWPRSRRNLPKQFLQLTDDNKTMIQLTVERILPIVDAQDIFIVTNRDYKELVMEQLPEIPQENILCEPVGKNTAPAIGWGAIEIEKKYGEAMMLVLPSDHLIKYKQMYVSVLKDAVKIAQENGNLVTLGITPTKPETGYGYIKFNPEEMEDHAYRVAEFVEKPDYETAKHYLDTEEYLWNSGMFIWKTSTILKNFKQYLPQIYDGLMTIKQALVTEAKNEVLEACFSEFPSESIDFGILEKAKDIFVLPGAFGWDDLGSWLAVSRIRKANDLGNVVSGNVITIDSKNCIIEGSEKLIATIGLENIIVVDTQDATLICDKQSTGDIKKVLENLKICNRDQYL